MMIQNRLDGVLQRNRRNLVLDAAMALLLLVSAALSAILVAAALAASATAPAAIIRAATPSLAGGPRRAISPHPAPVPAPCRESRGQWAPGSIRLPRFV